MIERSFYFYDSEGYHENVFISCELVRDAKVQVWNQIFNMEDGDGWRVTVCWTGR